MNDGIWVVVVPAAALVLGGLITYIGTRGKTQTDAKTALDARLDARVDAQLSRLDQKVVTLEGRVEELEEREVRRSSAFARILRAIARQWPGESTGPDLDPADIAEIEDTIPPQWIRRHPEMLNNSKDHTHE